MLVLWYLGCSNRVCSCWYSWGLSILHILKWIDDTSYLWNALNWSVCELGYVNLCFKILRFVALGSYLSFTFLNQVYTIYLWGGPQHERVYELGYVNLYFKFWDLRHFGGCLLSQVSTLYDFFQKWVTLFLFAGMIQDLLWKLWWKICTIPTHHGNHGCHLAMATHDAWYSPPAKIWKPPCRYP